MVSALGAMTPSMRMALKNNTLSNCASITLVFASL